MKQVRGRTVDGIGKTRRWGLLLLGVALGAGIFFAQAGGTQSLSGGTAKRFDIDDPEFRGYPKRFDGMGSIDRIGADGIVIGDKFFRMSPSVTYHTPRNKFAPLSWLKTGLIVGYIKNAEGRIVSLWLMDKGS